MVIRSLNRVLHVLQILTESERLACYLCTDLSEEVPQQYVVNVFRDTSAYGQLMPLFLAQEKHAGFSDLAESFSLDGSFYVLFHCEKGTPLADGIGVQPLEERLEAGKRLLEYMVLQDMDFSVQCAMLSAENVLWTETHEVRFLYQFPETFRGDAVSFSEVEQACLQWMQRLFSRELEMQYSEPLLRFCRELNDGESYRTYAELYAAYDAVRQDLLSQKDHPISGKYRFRLWEKIKRNAARVRRGIVILLGLAAVGLFVYEMFFAETDTADYTPYTQIGTLVIRENADGFSETETTVATETETEVSQAAR